MAGAAIPPVGSHNLDSRARPSTVASHAGSVEMKRAEGERNDAGRRNERWLQRQTICKEERDTIATDKKRREEQVGSWVGDDEWRSLVCEKRQIHSYLGTKGKRTAEQW